MNVDPNQVVSIEVPAGALLAALAALGKMPYEQVVQAVTVIEQALQKALTPPPAEKAK